MAKELDMLNKSLQENLDLTAYSQVGHTHNYAGSSTAGGAANTAVKLHTARTINGTSFDGSGNITTANWGTARTITIGNSGKSVNGSANVSWTLAEIGAAAASHSHNVLSVKSDNYKDASALPSTYDRGETVFFSNNPTNKFNGITYCTVHTIKGYNNMACIQYIYPYNSGDDKIYYRTAQYNSDTWRSWATVYSSLNKPTPADIGAAAASHGTHVTYATATPSANGTAAVGTSSKVAREDHVHPLQTTISGAAGSAGKWTTARTLTIGNSGKSVDGSANVTWTLAEIGALPLSGGTMTGAITTPNNAQGIKIGDDAVICDRNIANHIVIEGATATNGGITFGSGKDTNIYRGGANLLKTDDTFNAVGGLQWNGESLDTRYAKASHGSHISFSTTTPKVAGTAAIGSDSGAARGDHVHPAQTSVSGNAGTATKLQTARTIALGTGVTSTATSFNGSANITIPVTGVKEAYLEWGGKNFTGSFGPIDAAMVPHLGANRLAFMPAAGVAFEYSTDGGTTWAAYSTSDSNKINFFNGNGAAHCIGASTATKIDKTNYMFRVTITASTAKVYTVLNKFVIYCSVNGSTGSYCSIDARTQANVTAGTDTWVNFANKVSIAGWSGYNVINTSGITVGTNSSQYGQLRFTFGVTSHASTVEYAGLQVSMVMGFGGVGWTTPSTMAAKGRMYTYDASQNVTFPAQVTATKFNGPLNGNANTATKWSNARTLTIGNSAKTYDGSGNATFTLSDIGAAASDHNHDSTYSKTNHTHNYAGSSSAGGSATSAVKLATARTITIGNKSNSFDGTANISYTLADIGAAASSHNHAKIMAESGSSWTTATKDVQTDCEFQFASHISKSATGLYPNSNNANAMISFNRHSGAYASQLGFSSNGKIYYRWGNGTAITDSTAWEQIYTSVNKPTPADIGAAASSHGTHVTYSTTTPKVAGTATVGSESAVARGDHVHPVQTSVSGNAGTATKLATARTIQIGNKSNTFDGSANITYTLADIGAAPISHGQHAVYGTCDTAAATAEKVITVSGSGFSLAAGQMISVKFTTSNTASSVKFNVNSTGAKPIWYNNAEYTGNSNRVTGYANAVMTYVYNGSHWVWVSSGVDNNTTYSNVSLGHGYATCDTAEATVAKVGTLSSYALTKGGIVAVKFTYAVPASATLNINSKGAKSIYFRNAAITANIIKAGDTATFIYDGSYYQLLSIDRWQNDITSHTHNYAGSSSAGGAANSAVKWSTARTLTIGNTGKSVDGSANVSWSISEIGAIPLTGNTGAYSITGNLEFASPSNNTFRGVVGKAGVNDYWRVGGQATADNAGYMEIATADDANEPIYVRQYSGAYSTLSRTLTLLDASGNTSMPGSLSVTKGISCTDVTAKGNVTVTGTVKVGSVTMKYNDTSESLDFIFG